MAVFFTQLIGGGWEKKMILLFSKTWELSRVTPKLEFIESTDNDKDLT